MHDYKKGGRQLSGAGRRPRRQLRSGAHARPYRRTSGGTVFLRFFYTVGLFFVLATVGHATYGYLLTSPHLRISKVEVTGLSEPVSKELRALVADYAVTHPSLFSLNLPTLQRTVSAHPRVKNVQLQKVWPDKLVIRANERTPCAVLIAGKFYLLDPAGYVMEEVKGSQLRAYNLPYISGVPMQEAEPNNKIKGKAIERALELLLVVKDRNPELYDRISEVNVSKDAVSKLDNIVVNMKDGGMEVRFGDTNPVEKLPALELFIRMQREKQIDPFSMTYVDLRFKNQIVFMDYNHGLAKEAGILDQLTAPPESTKRKESASKSSRSSDSTSSDDSSGDSGANPRASSASAYDMAKQTARDRATSPNSATLPQSTQPRAYSPAADNAATLRTPAQEQPRRGILGRAVNIFRRDKER